MKYLNENIAQKVKKNSQKSLVHKSKSCGIFQDTDWNSSTPFVYISRKTK